MSTNKEAEERKKEILDVAEGLFVTKGYESASTTDILEKVGIARGTLYYHFKSKEEILDALIDRTIQQIVLNINQALKKEDDVVHKIVAFVGAMKVDSDIGKEITDYAHKPQNALMHQKIQKSLLGALTPIAVKVIEQGNKEGILDSAYPYEAAETLLVYSSVVFDDINGLSEDEWERKAIGYVYNMERLLGVQPGTFSEVLKYIR